MLVYTTLSPDYETEFLSYWQLPRRENMIIGVPKETKNKEFRVGLVPAGVRKLAHSGHSILIESGAGLGSEIFDQEYEAAGAKLVHDAATLYTEAELIVKVKEPLEQEYTYMREGLVLFTYLHLRGILLGGVTGVEPGHVVILGSGTVGTNAAQMAVGLGASVTVIGRNPAHLAVLEDTFSGKIETKISSRENIAAEVSRADLVIGAVLVPGAVTPKLITRDMLSLMQKGAVLVDVSIDQGGCIETARPTTHSDPVYAVDGIIHYCVANMPGAVPRTSTFALTTATLPFALAIANKGLHRAIQEDTALKSGVNTYNGLLTNKEIADSQKREFIDIDELIS